MWVLENRQNASLATDRDFIVFSGGGGVDGGGDGIKN